jgi:hypothetical protein
VVISVSTKMQRGPPVPVSLSLPRFFVGSVNAH